MQPQPDARVVAGPRHGVVVRVTHWLTLVAFVALVISGVEIVFSHPRFYLGETGNVNMKPLFTLPVASSRDTVPTAYKYILPDQNGWSRYLHFEAAWLLLFVGAVYVVSGWRSGRFRREIVPQRSERNWRSYWGVIGGYLRVTPRREESKTSYNVLQRTVYFAVIFVAFPLMIWTGLAMSPAFTAVVPWCPLIVGGRQTARTLHFFLTWGLVLFFITHVAMVSTSGFVARMRGMITGGDGAVCADAVDAVKEGA
ncbi:Thiosulfate reductase cytochrome b subunit [Bryocella elongata]|uniref:Thiosulfate reductase cytochrome b subunit n=2 Tax=Bryocella elongata TaxID=863522 RepID=A0A1H5WU15_9BACT|nr:Thiosulfate reductase cytochrome b subunit [Bryocella elongata]